MAPQGWDHLEVEEKTDQQPQPPLYHTRWFQWVPRLVIACHGWHVVGWIARCLLCSGPASVTSNYVPIVICCGLGRNLTQKKDYHYYYYCGNCRLACAQSGCVASDCEKATVVWWLGERQQLLATLRLVSEPILVFHLCTGRAPKANVTHLQSVL